MNINPDNTFEYYKNAKSFYKACDREIRLNHIDSHMKNNVHTILYRLKDLPMSTSLIKYV